ncbi:hypothetical protein CROQUDRAFT_88233 [Cronartium quercuum f. sp. fusiforme G11]|uniref:Uncharacterized protein n=1 Tax=Cronartium quercuum f. sp. fusiforme G11 TaxID=708437 RepID=A0A9P6NN38_9BASI|nr:hypothetical protein CROQUDRAFT_88233 [Cronartium quercuum f. sp. fusiforme G11]
MAVHSFDVTAAYLHSLMNEMLYFEPPPGVKSVARRLNRDLRALKAFQYDQSLHVCRQGDDTRTIWLHVDDGAAVTANSEWMLDEISGALVEKLMIRWSKTLDHIVGAVATRPDLTHTVNFLARISADPTEQDWEASQHVKHYLHTTGCLKLYLEPVKEDKTGLQTYVGNLVTRELSTKTPRSAWTGFGIHRLCSKTKQATLKGGSFCCKFYVKLAELNTKQQKADILTKPLGPLLFDRGRKGAGLRSAVTEVREPSRLCPLPTGSFVPNLCMVLPDPVSTGEQCGQLLVVNTGALLMTSGRGIRCREVEHRISLLTFCLKRLAYLYAITPPQPTRVEADHELWPSNISSVH